MSATAADMARFMLALLGDRSDNGDRVLEADSVEEMSRRQFSNHDAINGMGLGMYEMDRSDLRIVGHGGDTMQFHSLLALFPDHDVGLFVSFNGAGSGDIDVRDELLDAFVDEFFDPAVEPPTGPERISRSAALEGTYRTTRIAESTYEKLAGADAIVDVAVEDDGTLVTSFVGYRTRRWIQIEPFVFREVDGHDTLAFREGANGRPSHVFLGSEPFVGFERLETREEPLVQAVAFAASVLVLLSAVVSWPAVGGWRRYRGHPPDDTRPRVARWIAGAMGTLFLTFVVAVVWLVVTDPLVVVFGDERLIRYLLILPILGAIATVGAVAFAVWSWQERYWGLVSRIHYTLVTASAVILCWLLYYWNVLGIPP